ncbi:MAG: hypothetical protein RR623_09545 [Bacilli bacterium]
MKVLIMGLTKIKFMPYMNFYINNINLDENEVHLIYWNRDLMDEDLSQLEQIKLHEFCCFQNDDVSKLSKIKSFIKYREFVKEILKKNNFEMLFILHSLTGVIIADILKNEYKGKYIFDYRDSTYEKLNFFKMIIKGLVLNSKATFVSSDGFRQLLPKYDKIYPSHNFLIESLEHRKDKVIYGTKSNKIRIAFWGFIRHEEINRKIIKKISEDERFELHYYGREQEIALRIKKYAEEINTKNVFFHGEYRPNDRYDFIRNTDIIHNIYYDYNTMLAMANKYYDGIIFRIPQICMTGSFMGHEVTSNEIGLECNPNDTNFTEKIYQYFIKINFSSFYEKCDMELVKIINEFNEGTKHINNFFD